MQIYFLTCDKEKHGIEPNDSGKVNTAKKKNSTIMFLNNNDHTKLIRTTVYKKKIIVFKIKILKQNW